MPFPSVAARTVLRLALAGLATVSLASAQAQDEVPFVVTPDNVTLAMLRLADVGARDHVIDLGSGDGRIVITAANRFGASGLGVEIVGDLVRQSRAVAASAGVADRVAFREQDLFLTDLAPATVVTMYLLPEVNLALRPRLLALAPGTRIVSHDWDMGDWRPDRTTELDVPDKQVGREKKSRVHLWVVPARVAGEWCGAGPLRGARLSIEQAHQRYRGTLRQGRRSTGIEGVISGTELRLAQGRGESVHLRLDGGSLRRVVGGSEGPGAFQRC